MTHPAIAALLACPARRVPGADLLARLSHPRTDISNEEIEVAINEAAQLAYRTQRMVKRCLELKPCAAKLPPLGF